MMNIMKNEKLQQLSARLNSLSDGFDLIAILSSYQYLDRSYDGWEENVYV